MAIYTYGASTTKAYYSTSDCPQVIVTGASFEIIKPAWQTRIDFDTNFNRYYTTTYCKINIYSEDGTKLSFFPSQDTAVVSDNATWATFLSSSSNTINTIDIFNENNNTDKTVTLYCKVSGVTASAPNSTSWTIMGTTEQSNQNISLCNVILDVPPTFDISTMSKNTPVYVAGITTASVTVSNATAYYGGDISSVKLTVGTQSATISDNGTISLSLQNVGTYTPTVTVTDSRGQTKTENLAQITVLSYEKPSVDFDIFRTDGDGIKSDEGSYGVIAANFTYMGEVANLTEPTISINNTSLTNYYAKTLDTVVDNNKTYYTYGGGLYTVVANPIDADIDLYYEKASITWYSNYDSQTGVSAPITNWSQVGLNNTATIYGLVDACFAALESYQITFVETDSLNGQSEAITQILSTAFYTIDFQAGGKEIAFGAPANDDLTNYSNGLFKCGMDAMFRDNSNTMRMLFDFIYPIGSYYETSDITFNPNIVWGGTWVLETEGQVHISGSPSGTYQVIGAPTDTNDGGEEAHKLSSTESFYPARVSTTLAVSSTPVSSSGASKYAPTIGTANKWTKYDSHTASAHNNMQPYIIVNRWHRVVIYDFRIEVNGDGSISSYSFINNMTWEQFINSSFNIANDYHSSAFEINNNDEVVYYDQYGAEHVYDPDGINTVSKTDLITKDVKYWVWDA